MKNLIFEFEKIAPSGGVTAEAKRAFARAGASVVQVEAGAVQRGPGGIKFKPLSFVFADGQSLTMRIKETGDIFQVLLNGRARPIAHQDDHGEAIKELVAAMDQGRAGFVKAQAKKKVAVPSGVKSTVPRKIEAVTAQRDALQAEVSELEARVSAKRAERDAALAG
jgi:hypothetical protein